MCCFRTKIQIAERIFHFVLPQLEPVASIAPDSLEALSPLTEPLSDDELSSLSDGSDEPEADHPPSDDSALSDDSSSSLSSLSSLSDSDIELSPLRTAADPGGMIPRLDLPPRKAPSKKAPSKKVPRKAQYGQVAGKRLEMLQAVRNGGVGSGGKGGGGRGKGGMGSGGKGGGGGKKAPRKGKSVPSRPYWEHDDEGDSDSDSDSDEDEGALLPPHGAVGPANAYPATYGVVDLDDPFAEEIEEGDDHEDKDFGAPKSHKKGASANPSRSGSVSVPPTHSHAGGASTSAPAGVVLAAEPGAAEGPPAPKVKVSHKKREAPWVPLPPRPPSPIILDRPRIRKLVIKPPPVVEAPARKAPKKTTTQGGKMPRKGPAAASASPDLAFGGPGSVKMEGQFSGGHVLPNGQVKRPRGRPPKNGICAQRPRKPKPPVQTIFTGANSNGRPAWPAQQDDEESSDLSSDDSDSSEEEDVKPTAPAPVRPTPPPIAAPAPRAPSSAIHGFTKMSWIAQGNTNTLAAPPGSAPPAKAASPAPGPATAAEVQPKEPSPAPTKAAAGAAPLKANKLKTKASPAPDTSATPDAPLGPYDLPLVPGQPQKAEPNGPLKPAPAAEPVVHPKPVEGPRTKMGTGPDGADESTAKPSYTYASLVAQAINAQESRKCSAQGIFDFLARRWPWFRDGDTNQPGWQNSIKHNMTLSKGFLKLPLENPQDKAAPQLYMVDPEADTFFDGLNFRKKTVKPPAAAAALSSTAPAPGTTPASAGATAAPARPAPAPLRPPAKAGAVSSSPLNNPLPILVCPIPASYVRPTQPAPSAQPQDELTAALLKDPPIVLHEGKLILNPGIFENLPQSRIDELSREPASKALGVLQAFVVAHFKEKMRKREADKGVPAAGAVGGKSVSSGPAKRKLDEPAAGEAAAKVAKVEEAAAAAAAGTAAVG